MSKPAAIQIHNRLLKLTVALSFTLITQTPQLLAQNASKKNHGSAQHEETVTGAISGRAIDDKKEPLFDATVEVFYNGVLKGGADTDEKGFYTINGLEPGKYEVIGICFSHDSIRSVVQVTPKNKTTLDLHFKANGRKPIIMF